MAAAERIYFADDTCRIAVWENLAIFDIAGAVEERQMLQLEAAFLQLHQERDRAIGVLAVLRASAPVPLPSGRQHAVRILKAYGWIARVAVVCEGTGVATQMLKTVVRSIKMLAGASRLAIIDSLDQAEAELFARVIDHSGPITLDQLKSAVRSSLSARPGRDLRP